MVENSNNTLGEDFSNDFEKTDKEQLNISANRFDASAVHHLSGMYRSWFLDYASYVILERAVPHIEDGLKPVQRRILHSMKRMDDGRYNKVANIVGHTMQFHPHGDASIGDALVQLGQKEVLVETQGNWGNILTGSSAAAPRYIEARLSKFALETVFNPKTTLWKMSYDGRNKEPITLPVKFPLLLSQGAEGIAVGLSSKILPHNFNELCDAAICFLKEENFNLYPDFPTGGSVDVSKYNDGKRGGSVKVRAKIEKFDAKTLIIREIPFSKTSETLIDSITKAIEKGKIKARKVEDLTAANTEIQIHLSPGISADKTIDALYAFTDCEVSISPNCCVIMQNKPHFLGVGDVLRYSVNQTKHLIQQELSIQRAEILEQLHFASLEKIFIEERIYKAKQFENAETNDAACKYINDRLEPFKENFIREVTKDDLLKLLEIKMQRILKFNADKAEGIMLKMQQEVKDIEKSLANLTNVTIKWFKHLKEKYGNNRERLTEIRNFDTIKAAKVVEANEKLYIDRKGGFVGTGLKKDEVVCQCSDLDEIIVFHKHGKYKVLKVDSKIFVGKDILHVQVYKRNDVRTTYNIVYRETKSGYQYIKRFNITSAIRDREYNFTPEDCKVIYFSANSNGEAEIVKVSLKSSLLNTEKITTVDRDFAKIPIKSRSSKGALLSKMQITKLSMKSKGHSTLGGRMLYFDADVNRLNYEKRGNLIGEFNDNDYIVVLYNNGECHTMLPNINTHFEENIAFIEKLNNERAWTVAYKDFSAKKKPMIKRFFVEKSTSIQRFAGENENNEIMLISGSLYPRIKVNFGKADKENTPMILDVERTIPLTSIKAKGKKLSDFYVQSVEELQTEIKEDDMSEEKNNDKDQEIAQKENNNKNKSKNNLAKDNQLDFFDDEVL